MRGLKQKKPRTFNIFVLLATQVHRDFFQIKYFKNGALLKKSSIFCQKISSKLFIK